MDVGDVDAKAGMGMKMGAQTMGATDINQDEESALKLQLWIPHRLLARPRGSPSPRAVRQLAKGGSDSAELSNVLGLHPKL